MATLNYQTIPLTGGPITFAAVGGSGDKVASHPRGVVLIRNASGGSINVTIDTPGNYKYGQARPQIVTAVADGATAKFGPFADDLENPSDDLVALTYSGTTSVTIAALYL